MNEIVLFFLSIFMCLFYSGILSLIVLIVLIKILKSAKSLLKRIIAIIILVIPIFSFFYIIGVLPIVKYNLSQYNNENSRISLYTDKSKIMPTINELGNYTDIDYRYTKRQFFFWEADSELVSVEYGDND
ncbi:MAG: hypothetical protein ACI4VF_01975, partial [Lachnospirales bacterium]